MKNNIFEEIKKVNENGVEYWEGRELMPLLGYNRWENFEKVIKKAIVACEGSGQEKDDHFRDATKMVEIGSSTVRQVRDWKLDRYACYLIAQNGDSKKQEIALAQTYFAIQTRKQEEFDQLLEDKKRLDLRGEIKKHNVSLAEAAGNAGVVNYGKFQNFGYKGLYGGLDANDIHKKKKLKKTQKILDHMGSEELAANLFRATQADAKLRRDKIKGEERANVTHFAVGQKVRKTIEDLGGTMPEELPSTDGICNSKKRIGNDEKKNKILEK